MPDDHNSRLHIDLEGRTRLALPRNHPERAYRLRCGQSADGWDAPWRVDAIALSMPWRPDGLPSSDDEKVTFVRLAVYRAWEAARQTEARRRGRRECVLNLKRGDPLFGGKRLPDLIDRARTEGRSPSPRIEILALMAAERLGVALKDDAEDGARLRAAVAGKQYQGRLSSIELPVFVRSLALFWWENTRSRPERRVNDARKAEQRGTFFDFAVAAAIDCSRSGRAEPEGLRSVIRHEIASMEKSGRAPWMPR